jgi:outer membrane protein
MSIPAQQRSALAVKKLIPSVCAIAILAGLLTLGNNVWSQTGKPAARPAAGASAAVADDAKPHKVGLIDMAHVFKNYKKFESLREELKGQIAGSEDQAKEMAGKIKKLQDELKTLKEGSDDFTKKEQAMNKLALDFDSFRKSTQREILKAESEIYHQVYMEVSDAVRKYSKYYGYTLVLRFNREELNKDDPQGLIQGMNRQVVFHRDEDDMTESVLVHLNEQFEKAGSAPREAANRPR